MPVAPQRPPSDRPRGSRLSDSVTISCPQCRGQNPPHAAFCGSCGTRLVRASNPAPRAKSTSIRPGKKLRERYVLKKPLGSGGMADVFLAFDERHQRDVAIKVMHATLLGHATGRKRMEREALALCRIHHPNVIEIFDAFDWGGLFVLALEPLLGGSLADRMTHGPLVQKGALSTICDVLSGLSAVHAAELVHRDIKPANVLYTVGGVLKVADLGIARDNENRGLSRTGARLGTAEYMSPEQIRGTNIDARSDIYACGIVLYELLHGSVPFTGPSEYDVFEKAVSEPVNLEVLRGAASDAVRAAVGCALAKDPAGRWPSADTFRAALLAAK